MAIITRLVQGKKNQSRVNLYLDDQFAFALSIDEVARHSLKKGLELTSAQVEELKATDALDYVYAKILNFLSYRPRTIREVRDRLIKYELLDEHKQTLLIDKLKSRGYLDDLAFARWFVASRNTHRPRSARMLISELRSKGVDQETIQAVVSDFAQEETTILQLVHKKLGQPRVLTPGERQKIFGFLSRQGFAWDKVVAVVKSWESE